jgi:methyltransferase (TIGR00027 family)
MLREHKPSYTAYKIAIGVVTLGADPVIGSLLSPGMVESTARLLVESGAAWEPLVQACRQGRLNWLIRLLEWLLGPRYSEIYRGIGHRKLFCERQVRGAISEGARQVLVLGAGYDTLAWRLALEFPQVTFTEIDHPATGRLKRRGIDKMGTRANLHLVQADLTQESLLSVLGAQPEWKVEAPSLFVAEGLMMYLPIETVSQLLIQCAALSGTSSRFAFDYLITGAKGKPDLGRLTELVTLSFKLIGEPLLWTAEPESIPNLIAETGWDCRPDLVGVPADIGMEGFAVLQSQARFSGTRDS